jgi:hypothetical protein
MNFYASPGGSQTLPASYIACMAATMLINNTRAAVKSQDAYLKGYNFARMLK